MIERSSGWVVVALGLGVATLLSAGPWCRGLAATADEPEKLPRKTIAEIAKDRPAPDLTTLAARSKPDVGGPEATESFYDILKLRTAGNEAAVPVLGEILTENLANGHRIHGYAAAQALFCIGTPAAQKLLTENLLTDRYSADLGILYATRGWGMDPVQATAFIEQYHLKNLAKDLRLTLELLDDGDDRSLRLLLTEENLSGQPLRIERSARLSDEHLHWQDLATDQFLGEANHTHCKDSFEWIELAPGEKQVLELKVPRSKLGQLWYPADAVKPGGRVRVYALLEVSPLYAGHNDTPTAKAWSGRALSKPVEITLPEQKED